MIWEGGQPRPEATLSVQEGTKKGGNSAWRSHLVTIQSTVNRAGTPSGGATTKPAAYEELFS